MTYEQALKYIQRPYSTDVEYKMDRIYKILELLNNPQDKIRCIHIAGTNGKGSVSAMTAKILEMSGYKTGLYISPHLIDFEERIRINSKFIEKSDIAKMMTKIAVIVDDLIEKGYGEPTEFELITCLAYYYFYKQNVDFAVIEVGLGGLTDSTNVITPILSVITSVSYDHMAVLGNEISLIARQKAGIIKKGVPVVLYNQRAEVMNVIKKVCVEKNSPLIIANSEIREYTNEEVKEIFNTDLVKNSPRQYFNIKTKNDSYDIALNLLGLHQMKNTDVVINVAETLQSQGIEIKKSSILSALENVTWIGRMEIVKANPVVMLDGAHNIDAIKQLSQSIKKYFSYNKLILITGILKDKQVDEMSEILAKLSDKIIAVEVDSVRRTSKDALIESLKKYNKDVEGSDDYKDALDKALSYADEDDMILICGSLYLIGDYKKICMTYL